MRVKDVKMDIDDVQVKTFLRIERKKIALFGKLY